MENTWISYVGRSYSLIKTSFMDRLRVKLPELTDKSPSNLLVLIVDKVASLVEVLNYYVDNMARETFIPTVRRLSSMLKLAHSLNYNGKARIPSKADLTVTLVTEDGVPTPAGDDIGIPKYSQFFDKNNNPWLVLDDTAILKGFESTVVQIQQGFVITDEKMGLTTGVPNQTLELPATLAYDSQTITINTELWTPVESFEFSLATDKHYKVFMGANQRMYVMFGDNNQGIIPTQSLDVLISYISTLGYSGNLEAEAINRVGFFTADLGTDKLICTNSTPSHGGYDVEDLEKLRVSIPNSIYSLHKMVTRGDYERLTASAPGVRTAKLDHNTPVYPIKIYIVPNIGGIASLALRNSTKAYISKFGLIGPTFNILPAGESKVVIDVDIYGEYGAKEESILLSSITALRNLYHPQKTALNTPVLVSDLVSTLHNLELVDHVVLKSFYINPYLRPNLEGTSLVYQIRVLKQSLEVQDWTLVYYNDDPEKFILYRSGTIVMEIPIANLNTWNLDVGGLGILDIKINSVVVQDPIVQWTFKIYPYNRDSYLTNFTIPTWDYSNSTLSIIENNG